jgi:acyl-coenzyme A thioesterase PaaI-like protein
MTGQSLERKDRKQPNSRNCFACGLENPHGLGLTFHEISGGEVVSEVTIPGHFEGYPGIVHGGIIASMLDEIVSRAAMYGDHEHFYLTAKLEVRYRSPVPTQTPLRLRGEVRKDRGGMKVSHGELLLPDGTVAAEADALLAAYSGTGDDADQLAALGWRVYPDD